MAVGFEVVDMDFAPVPVRGMFIVFRGFDDEIEWLGTFPDNLIGSFPHSGQLLFLLGVVCSSNPWVIVPYQFPNLVLGGLLSGRVGPSLHCPLSLAKALDPFFPDLLESLVQSASILSEVTGGLGWSCGSDVEGGF